ncbi:MAG TPA: MerR family transcriptional regulator [Ruminococcaceae bacterium]|nr:MerR family transcriptional regulator [Oscillospiraceae bacterium]
MSKYSTGELAKLCGVSVRTVQFYDTKGLLPPAELTEGGRRIYSSDDLSKLRLICMLKAMGLTLDTIRGILRSEAPGKVLMLLLDEQIKRLGSDIKEKKEQIDAIKIVRENIRNMDVITVNSIGDIEHIMKSKKGLRKIHGTMLAVGLIMDAIQIGTVVLWIVKGLWLPFAVGMPLVILFGVLLTRMYYKNTAYICAECNTIFRPSLGQFLFSAHTPKTRKLKCTKCGHKGYCVETLANE